MLSLSCARAAHAGRAARGVARRQLAAQKQKLDPPPRPTLMARSASPSKKKASKPSVAQMGTMIRIVSFWYTSTLLFNYT